MRWLTVALFLGLAACQAPIEVSAIMGESDAAALDPRLPGLWYAEDVEDGEAFRVFVLITPRPGTPYLDVLAGYSDPAGDGEPDWTKFGWFRATAFATTVAGQTYYAATRKAGIGFDYTPIGLAPGTILVRAEFDAAGDLTLAGIAETALVDYGLKVDKFSIRGDDTYRRVEVDREALLAVLSTVGPDLLFAERWGPLRRASGAAAPFTLEGQPAP